MQGDSSFLKFDASFQFFSSWISGLKTPMHCGITQAVHCLTKSRELIDIINRFGFGIGYD